MELIRVHEVQIDPIKINAFHYFILANAGLDCGYKEVRTYNSFFNNFKKKYNRDVNRKFIAQDEIMDTNVQFTVHGQKIPKIRHETIYDFFMYIGFDNKTKKFK